ncbi:MAG: AraC family transcriptional regulator, partial [Myxococcota bacterium]
MGTAFSPAEHREVYASRVNRAIDYIEAHLHEELSLEPIAKAAHFSPHHFHRIFGALTGETLSRFIQRIRVEKAASLLLQLPHRSVTEIAIDCGYSSPAVFARAFKQAFGMSATAWRNRAHDEGVAVPSRCKPLGSPDGYGVLSHAIEPSTGLPSWVIRCPEHAPVQVHIAELPAWDVAYARHTGPYQGMAEVFEALFQQLMGWAGPRGLLTSEAKVLAVYHDDPNITEDDKLRVSACVTVPQGIRGEGTIGTMRLAGGRYAIGRFVLGERDYARAWHAMMGGWLPESGFEPDDRSCFEWYRS